MGAVRDPQQQFEPQALLCTDLTVDPVRSWSSLSSGGTWK
jgi:hypothetical protein